MLASLCTLFCSDAEPQAPGTAGSEEAEPAAADYADSAPTREFDPEEAERLRALGYIDVVEEGDDSQQEGVIVRDAARMQPGLTYFTEVSGCGSKLIDEAGGIVARWDMDECEVWGNSILRPNGDVIAVQQDPHDEGSAEAELAGRRLLHFDFEGKLLRSLRIPVHHDIDVMPDGRIAALTYRHRVIPEIHERVPVRDHYVAELDFDGSVLRETSITELMLGWREQLPLESVRSKVKAGLREIDLVHTNAIEFLRDPALAAKNPRLYGPDNVMICVRHQNLAFIVNWKTRELIWHWGSGEISGPHDATLLPSGNVLIFDNGLGRHWSRVVEVDPATNEIVWEYRAPEPRDFYTITRGASQRLENGNTLVTYSRNGSIFEITPEGEVVWEYWVPRAAQDSPRSRIVRARRLPRPSEGAPYAIVD